MRPDPLPGKLVKTVMALPPGPVDLLCPVHPTPERGPTSQAVQTKRCLAALGSATLLELAVTEREVWLDDTFCKDCPLAKIQPTLLQVVNEANAWASLLKNSTPLSLRSRQIDSPPSGQRSVYEADCPPTSRRGFFRAFKQLGPQNPDETMVEALTPSTRSGWPVPLSQRLHHFVPRQRANILAIIDRGMKAAACKVGSPPPPPALIDEANTLPVAKIKVDTHKCSACNLCAHFCPTEALVFLSDEKRFALGFHCRLCLGEACNICVVTCPEEAVSLQSAVTSPDLVNNKRHYLAVGDLTACERCGKSIAAGPERLTTCYACRLSTTQTTILTALFGPKNTINNDDS